MRGWIAWVGVGWVLLLAGGPADGEVCGEGEVTADCSSELGRTGCLVQGGC